MFEVTEVVFITGEESDAFCVLIEERVSTTGGSVVNVVEISPVIGIGLLERAVVVGVGVGVDVVLDRTTSFFDDEVGGIKDEKLVFNTSTSF